MVIATAAVLVNVVKIEWQLKFPLVHCNTAIKLKLKSYFV